MADGQSVRSSVGAISEEHLKGSFRRQVAKYVVLGTGLVLVVLTIGVWRVSQALYADEHAAMSVDFMEKYIYALLPMLGTWIGTVLAFYFTNDSFQTASSETRLTMAETRDARLRQVPVREAMIPISRVSAIAENELDWPAVYFDTEVIDLLNRKVSRIPVLDKGKSRAYGVVHDSIAKDYAWQNNVPAGGGTKLKTLDQFLSDPAVQPIFRNSLAFVGPSATLADVKVAMEQASTSGYPCRDVFVTEDGTATGKPLGMITNVDLEKFSSYG